MHDRETVREDDPSWRFVYYGEVRFSDATAEPEITREQIEAAARQYAAMYRPPTNGDTGA